MERRGVVGWIVFNRPFALNAMDSMMELELGRAWQELDADDAVKVIVNTGTGRAFQVGADLKAVASAGSMLEHQRRKPNKNIPSERSRITSRQWNVRKPVVCAVNGVCAGAGFHFVTDADFVIAATDASFVEPHVSVGQVSALEPVGLLPILPFGVIMRLVLLGRRERLDARRAYELGLVTQLVEPESLASVAQRLGEDIASNSPAAVLASKGALWDALNMTQDAAMESGMRVLSDFWAHPDNREGVRAFTERRQPRWRS